MSVKLDDMQGITDLLNTKWDQIDILCLAICPVCKGSVAFAQDGDEILDEYIQVHKDYHISMARLLSGLNAWHTPIG